MSVTVTISADAHAKLAELAAARKRAMGDLLADLIEREERQSLLDAANEDLRRLQSDPVEWTDYQAELRSMEGTLMDGLQNDPWTE